MNIKTLNGYFFIIPLMLFSFGMVNWSGRDGDYVLDADISKYRVEIQYSGDIQNWNEKLSVSTSVKAKMIPSITGVTIDSYQKISDTEYLFTLQSNSSLSKIFETSTNVIGISINGNITMKNSNANQLIVNVKVYENNELKFESPFVYNSSNTYPYYNININ